MSRTQRAFERRYWELLGELGARDREKGLAWLRHKASVALQSRGRTSGRVQTGQLIALLKKVHRFRASRGHHALAGGPCRVYCDAGLGGLARWLRASGFEAFWTRDITDADLVRESARLNAIIITTDGPLLERRAITCGEVPAIWVPPTLSILEQLRLVRAELDLPEGELDSRCMRCGGELLRVDKESMKDRIPPRTFRWLDEFWQCRDCGQLFWNGTHWRQIRRRLES